MLHMSMETTAWTQLHSVMNAEQERRPFARATLRRITAFAAPHRRRITHFVLLSVVTALLAVATPVLAGRVVDAIVSGAESSTVVRYAVLIAVIAIASTAEPATICWPNSATWSGSITARMSTAIPSGIAEETIRYGRHDVRSRDICMRIRTSNFVARDAPLTIPPRRRRSRRSLDRRPRGSG